MSIPAENGLITTILPEVCYPNVDPTAGLAPSPVIEFLADEEAASTCPLLTPSPPTEFEHPLSITPTTGMAYERQISPTSIDELSSLPVLNGNAALGFVGLAATDMPPNSQEATQEFNPTRSVQSVMESSSSSSSVMQEPTVCAQLLSSHHYQHLTKASDVDPFACQENGGKPPLTGLQLAVRKSPDDFCFLDWNWPLIRKFSFWGAISLLVACLCIVITLIARLPTKCNPQHDWWQGTLFYEVFPASFKDENADGIGDLRGIGRQAEYFTSIGVKVVRLNSIFYADHYPENYDQLQNLTEIAPVLGTIKDFNYAVNMLHKLNISVLLDLPVSPYIKQLTLREKEQEAEAVIDEKTNWIPLIDSLIENENETESRLNAEAPNRIKRMEIQSDNMITNAISYWLKNGVDGIYLKGLEYLIHEPDFASQVREWRKVTKSFNQGWENEKILMCSMDVLNDLDPEEDSRKVTAVLNNMDLIDVRLDIVNGGIQDLKKQVDTVVKVLYKEQGYPWIHWHMGSIDTKRLTSQLPIANASLSAIMFEMMLPGTPSIFYGDEIGLEDLKDPDGERRDISHTHHLSPMHWTAQYPGLGFTLTDLLPWLPSSSAWSNVAAGHQKIIQLLSKLRDEAPSIYMNGVYKDHENLPNYDIKTVGDDIVIVERSYPRLHSYVVVSNFGSQTQTKDLSSIYYGGEVMADLRGRIGHYLDFHALTLFAGESIVIKLHK